MLTVGGNLPTLGTCRYGNFDFGPSVFTKRITVRTEWDKSNRTIIYSTYSITLETYLAGVVSGSPADSVVQAAVRELTQPCRSFVYELHGVGGLKINTGGRVKDVNWGPKPRVVDIEVGGMGGNIAKLTWEVEVSIPTCSDAAFQFEMMEFNFEVSYEIGSNGLTKRVIDGEIRIPQTRGNGGKSRRLNDSVDNYRQKINPPMIPGFRRIPGSFRLSYDKCTLFFSVQDEQMGPAIPPPGIIEITGHGLSFESTDAIGALSFTGHFGLSYKLARGTDAGVAWKHFKSKVQEKCAILGSAFPIRTSIREPNPYGPERWVECSVGIMAPMPLGVVLSKGAIWRPWNGGVLGGVAWKLWAASMMNPQTGIGPLGSRGEAFLVFDPGTDRITDLCGDDISTLSTQPRSPDTPIPVFDLNGVFPAPTAQNSWLSYLNNVAAQVDQGITILQTLPASENELKTGAKPQSGAGSSPVTASGGGKPLAGPVSPGNAKPSGFIIHDGKPKPPPNLHIGWQGNFLARPVYLPGHGASSSKGNPPDVNIQQRTKPSVFLNMSGSAVRIGFPIPAPQLVEVNGSPAVPANRLDKGEGFVQGQIASAMGVPIFAARWNQRYVLTNAASNGGTFPVPDNPLLVG